jgi:hypothetical protein
MEDRLDMESAAKLLEPGNSNREDKHRGDRAASAFEPCQNTAAGWLKEFNRHLLQWRS